MSPNLIFRKTMHAMALMIARIGMVHIARYTAGRPGTRTRMRQTTFPHTATLHIRLVRSQNSKESKSVQIILLSAEKEVPGNNGNTSSQESTQTSTSSFLDARIQEDAVGNSNKRATVENERHYNRQLGIFRDPNVDALLCHSDVCATNADRNSDCACDHPEPENGEEEENALVFVPYCRDTEEEKKRRESLGKDVAYSQGKLSGIAIGNIGYCPTSQFKGMKKDTFKSKITNYLHLHVKVVRI